MSKVSITSLQTLFCIVSEMLGDIKRVIRDDDATCELMTL